MMSTCRMFVVLIRLLGLALLGSVVVGCNTSDDDPRVDTPPPTLAERLQTVLDQAVTDGLPGAALAVRGNNVNFTGVAGVEEIATAVPINIHHRFYLASVGDYDVRYAQLVQEVIEDLIDAEALPGARP